MDDSETIRFIVGLIRHLKIEKSVSEIINQPTSRVRSYNKYLNSLTNHPPVGSLETKGLTGFHDRPTIQENTKATS